MNRKLTVIRRGAPPKGLNRREVKQVQKIVDANKLLKVHYTAMPGGYCGCNAPINCFRYNS